MTREHIFEVVKKNIVRTVDTVPEDKVTLEKSMKELGMNSLDIVEVVSLSMRELKIKVPRSELVKLKDIGGLVDLLHATAAGKSEA